MFRSGLVVAIFTLLSRIFGLLRELFIAFLFGATSIGDCVNVALKFPNLFRRIFGEGAFSTVFVPRFNDKLLISLGSAKKFAGEIFTLLLGALILVTMLMQIFMPSLMLIIAPGFNKEPAIFALAVTITRITTPYLIFVSIIALFGGILNSVGRFAAFAAAPIIMSLGVIIFTYFLQITLAAPLAASWALIIAGMLQLLFMWQCLRRADLLFALSLRVDFKDHDIKNFFLKLGPAILSSGTQQLNIFISQSIASFIPGAISILTYADRIYQFPLSMIGISFATILLPELAKIYKNNDQAKAIEIQTKAIKSSWFLSLPAAFGILLLSQPIIHIIYERGAFDATSTIKTAQAIAAFALGLPAFVLTKILLTIFYANHDTKTPFNISIKVMLVNIISNIVLMIPFAHSGIALGSSLAAWYNTWLLYHYAKKNYQFRLLPGALKFGFLTLVCTLLMSVVITIIYYNFQKYFYANSSLIEISALLLTIAVGIIVFAASSIYFKLPKILIS